MSNLQVPVRGASSHSTRELNGAPRTNSSRRPDPNEKPENKDPWQENVHFVKNHDDPEMTQRLSAN